MLGRSNLGWGDVTWGDKAMGRNNRHSTQKVSRTGRETMFSTDTMMALSALSNIRLMSSRCRNACGEKS